LRRPLSGIILALIAIGLLNIEVGPLFIGSDADSNGIQRVGWPRLDEVYMRSIPSQFDAVEAFRQCEVEMLPNLLVWSSIQQLMSENQTMVESIGYHYCYLGINCRDYVPNDYEQPDAGRPLAPLNWTGFRKALAWSGLSHEEKETAIVEIYGGPQNAAADSPVPPSLGVWHQEQSNYPGCNFTYAWELLEDSGFTIVSNKLVQPNGVEARDQIEVLSPSSAPTSVAFCQKFVDKWNDFFDNFLHVTNVNFWNNPVDFGTVLIPRAFDYRNFDMYFLCWSLSRFPDYLYDFFHSSQDYPGSNNAPGISDPTLDHDLEVIKFGTNETEALQACWDAQENLVFESVPCIYMYSRVYRTFFKNYTSYTGEPRWLQNMVAMNGSGAGYGTSYIYVNFGAENRWTWGLLHWNSDETGGALKYCNPGNVQNLHPGLAGLYDWNVLNRVEDSLLTIYPENSTSMPWIVCNWSCQPFVSEPLGINGSKIRFQIREGVRWHDLKPLTVEDIQFALNYSKNFPSFQPAWQYLVDSQIVDSRTIDVYLNNTSPWILQMKTAYDLASIATMFPKHIYNRPDSINANLWAISYQDWTGQPPPSQYPFMKALIGCGPYVFDYWDPGTATAHLVKFQEYWVNSPLKGSLIAPAEIEPDTPFEYSVGLVNAGSIDNITGEFVPAAIDYVEIYEDGNLIRTISDPILIDTFTHVVLGSYTHSGFPAGTHTLTCKTYAYGILFDEYTCQVNAGVSVPIHDIAVTEVKPLKTIVGQGFPLSINATIQNNGDFEEAFNVTVYANTTVVAQVEVALANDSSTCVIVIWSTVGSAKGNYVIWAFAWPTLNETETTDNNCTDGIVYVGIPGDVDPADGHVGTDDIFAIASHFGQEQSHPVWNAVYDIDGDSHVGIGDVFISAVHFGQEGL
jgi:ABC-type transport system substrate-binding protein